MMNDKFYKSIVFKLIISVVIIFIAMITISNYLINQKQNEMTEALLYYVGESLPAKGESIVVMINNAQLKSSYDFKLYTISITSIVLTVGSLIFTFIIFKNLAPLKNLQKHISKVDIENPETFGENILIENSATEIVDLTNSFNNLIDKIYRDYKRQKDFSANVAHELRTPVAVMKAQVDVFRRKTEDHETLKFIRRIDDNIDKLQVLIDSVLMFSQSTKLELSKLNLDTIIEEILFDLEDKLFQKNIKLNYVANNIVITTDDILLQRLLYNIIDNAIKYNVENGKINIETFEDDKNIEIKIADTGIGVGEKDKNRIFDLFYQVDESRKNSGFGIGLSLSKQIADEIGGKIIIEDNDPKGSIFRIIISKY